MEVSAKTGDNVEMVSILKYARICVWIDVGIMCICKVLHVTEP